MEFVRYQALESNWMKAAVIGSLWASVEIVAGTFLHNLQIPFSGTILTSFAIFLLAAFSLIWKEKGIIWRAGIICALMKSISPSAVIIGPMVGIVTEAFLFEFILLLFGRNYPGIFLGGAVTALSAILHKFFTLLILYGFDFVRILDSLYHYAVKQLDLSNLQPTDLILMLAFLYMMLGGVAALAGFMVGKNFLRSDYAGESASPLRLAKKSDNWVVSDLQKYSVLLILLHLAVMTGVLLLLNLDYFVVSFAISAVYLVYCMKRYPGAIHRLKKAQVLVQFLLILISSVLIWDILKMGSVTGTEGWVVGLKMVFRASLLIIGFSAVSVELKNPLVKAVLYRRGLASLYQSLTLAFRVLPDLVASFSRTGLSILNPVSLARHLLSTSMNLTELFACEQQNMPAVFILTGEVGSGKTTFAKKLVASLHEKGFKTGGFVAEGWQAGSERQGYHLTDLNSGDPVVLCRMDFHKDWAVQGRFYFNPVALDVGNRLLEPANLAGLDFVMIDEIGPLELRNQGWSSSIGQLCETLPIPQIWVVRKSILHRIIRKWNIGDVWIFDLNKDRPDEVLQTLIARATKRDELT